MALHLWTQIVGKARLAQTPWINHSWHATLYLTARGLTTSTIPYGARHRAHDRPNELPDAVPFAGDKAPRPYDAEAVRRFWRAMRSSACSFAFAPAFSGW